MEPSAFFTQTKDLQQRELIDITSLFTINMMMLLKSFVVAVVMSLIVLFFAGSAASNVPTAPALGSSRYLKNLSKTQYPWKAFGVPLPEYLEFGGRRFRDYQKWQMWSCKCSEEVRTLAPCASSGAPAGGRSACPPTNRTTHATRSASQTSLMAEYLLDLSLSCKG